MRPPLYTKKNIDRLVDDNDLQLVGTYENVKGYSARIEGRCKSEDCEAIWTRSLGVLCENKNFHCIPCLRKIRYKTEAFKYDLKGTLLLRVDDIHDEKTYDGSLHTIRNCLKGNRNASGRSITSGGGYWFNTEEEAAQYFANHKETCIKCNQDKKACEFNHHSQQFICNVCLGDFEKTFQCSYCGKESNSSECYFQKDHSFNMKRCMDCIGKPTVTDTVQCLLPTCTTMFETPIFQDGTSARQKYCTNKCKIDQMRLYRDIAIHSSEERILKQILAGVRATDKRKGGEAMSIDQLKMLVACSDRKCYWCGIDILVNCGKGISYEPSRISLDRKDNANKSHSYENTIISCEMCNIMRQTMSTKLFRALINNLQGAAQSVDVSEFETLVIGGQQAKPWNVFYNDKTKQHSFDDRKGGKRVYFDILAAQGYKCIVTMCEPAILKSSITEQSHFHLSVDRIESETDGKKTDHGDRDNLQCVMAFINRAKNTLGNQKFLEEWRARGFNKGKLSFTFPEHHDLNVVRREYNTIQGLTSDDERKALRAYQQRQNAIPFTTQEDAIIISERGKFGWNWKDIAVLLPGRTVASIQSRYRIIAKQEHKWHRIGSAYRHFISSEMMKLRKFIRDFIRVEGPWVNQLQNISKFIIEEGKRPSCHSEKKEEKCYAAFLSNHQQGRKTNSSRHPDSFRKLKLDIFFREYRTFLLKPDEIWNRESICYEVFVFFQKRKPQQTDDLKLYEWGRKQPQGQKPRRTAFKRLLSKYKLV